MESKHTESVAELAKKAHGFRRDILEMTYAAGSGHPGGSLSAIDIITVLYFHSMKTDPKNPNWPDLDRFILSKGHSCPALYAVLAGKGFFPKEELMNLRKFGSLLQGHPDMTITPGIEMSTGSLGQGLSVACGIAIAAHLDKKNYRVYCMIGDGESQEGNIWIGAMLGAHLKLDNLTAILDRNGLQIDGTTEQVLSLEPLSDKWRSFGWHVIEIDGHNMHQIISALELAATIKGKPTIIIAKTVKGKGISFMEGQVGYHGRALTKDEMEKAREELSRIDNS
ncbi:transketolase [Candidatus Bathyarchaeota archaeon]|nr:transketolase [Candidatus Bathyarchaeota archaeon]